MLLQFNVILESVISTLMSFSLASLQEPENMLAKYGLWKKIHISLCIPKLTYSYKKGN